jgi:hypothetical protein
MIEGKPSQDGLPSSFSASTVLADNQTEELIVVAESISAALYLNREGRDSHTP